ncbi:alpha/beta hydrolase family esterase [Couchioplanes caeruleus]|uniref:Polyhydroxybutyrate depolymerase n=2 Tax=Couchioplanes caeruleus TaxID=56438 RepID=A0A1K0FSD4_9ACTN|nr:PHB depolymerase family esterase [Couchioplanes caeruleus]OJF15725.1 polyhydroxybutyrate depolymerase [Couchioplanes caeruleus subsp. caeruleus]ROP31863.1 polyhydroxybutyrate depolymerase [Couchioplanes caeruleus]
MKRQTALAAVLLLLLAGCTRDRRDPSPAPSSAPSNGVPSAPSAPGSPPGETGAPTSALPVGRSSASLTVDGRQRTYLMYRPASAKAGAPLVVVLHGAVGTGRQAAQAYGWDAEADKGGFLVAYPDGVNRTWNVSPDCCGVAARDDVDDVGFITKLVAAVPGVDPKRVYATGISNGAMLAYRLACETTIFAAIGPVAGTMLNECDDPAPISIIHIHGDKDPTVPYGGGPGRRSNAGTGRLPAKIDGPSVPSLIDTWRRTDGCPAPATTKSGPVTTSVATCPQGRAVELITVAGAGHQWPGSKPAPAAERLFRLDPPSTALNATPTIWTFLHAHPKA